MEWIILCLSGSRYARLEQNFLKFWDNFEIWDDQHWRVSLLKGSVTEKISWKGIVSLSAFYIFIFTFEVFFVCLKWFIIEDFNIQKKRKWPLRPPPPQSENFRFLSPVDILRRSLIQGRYLFNTYYQNGLLKSISEEFQICSKIAFLGDKLKFYSSVTNHLALRYTKVKVIHV